MTKKEFLAAIEELTSSWQVFDLEGLIYSESWRCIFTELERARQTKYPPDEIPMTEWKRAAASLGITPEDAEALRKAADNEPGHDPELRRELLRATHLDRMEVMS